MPRLFIHRKRFGLQLSFVTSRVISACWPLAPRDPLQQNRPGYAAQSLQSSLACSTTVRVALLLLIGWIAVLPQPTWPLALQPAAKRASVAIASGLIGRRWDVPVDISINGIAVGYAVFKLN